MKIWNTPLDVPLRSSRLVRRIIIDHDLDAGWPFKWGGQWDLRIGNAIYPTGLTCLCWTGQDWIDFIKSHSV